MCFAHYCTTNCSTTVCGLTPVLSENTKQEDRPRITMNRIVFVFILIFVLIASVVNVHLILNDSDWSDRTYTLWNFVVSVLFAVWAVKDQEERGSKYLDLGYIYFFAWPIVLPLYLARSRGIEQGI